MKFCFILAWLLCVFETDSFPVTEAIVVSVSMSVSRPFLSNKRRVGLSLFRGVSPSETGYVNPFSSFEEKPQSSFLSKGVTGPK